MRFAHLLFTILILLKTFYVSWQAKDNFGGKNIEFYLWKGEQSFMYKNGIEPTLKMNTLVAC